MEYNDVLFFNLHRRYLNNTMAYGGFLGIYSLASFLHENGYEAQSYAGNLMEGKNLLDQACKEKKVSMIGLYCDYENVTENIFLSQYIKQTYGLPVIVGGPQATALTIDFVKESSCDAIVRYEGEMTVLELVHYFLDGVGSLDAIKGIAYSTGETLVIQPERELIENLDALPFINDECYLNGVKRYNELSVMTGRGCPFHCTFCHEGHHTRKVRFRTVENVLKEIQLFLEQQKNNDNIYIFFTDDTFTLKPERVKKLCEGLITLRKKRNFNWFCEGHIHTLYLHPEMIEYIATAGVQRIQLGIEAGTQKVLDAYRKGSTIEEIKSVVKKCRDAGIQQIYSNIILGGPFFTKEIYEQDKAFAKELVELGEGTVEIGAVSYWPLPETSITNNPKEYGICIRDYNFITTAGDYPQTETMDLTRNDILKMSEELDETLLALKKNMLKDNRVPKDRILSWYPKDYAVKSYSRWFYALKAMPEYYAWYEMLLTGEGIGGEYFDADTIMDAHPMRVIGLNFSTTVLPNGAFKISGNSLSKAETDVLIFSVGKLTVNEILAELNDTSSVQTEKYTKKKLLDVLKKLETKRLIVYSKY